MRYQWRFEHVQAENISATASGEGAAAMLSYVFLLWMDEREMRRIGDPERLAGFLVSNSDLTRREIAGLLNTLEMDTVDTNREFTFQFDGNPVEVTCQAAPLQSH